MKKTSVASVAIHVEAFMPSRCVNRANAASLKVVPQLVELAVVVAYAKPFGKVIEPKQKLEYYMKVAPILAGVEGLIGKPAPAATSR